MRIGWIVIAIGILLLVGSGFGLMASFGLASVTIQDTIQGSVAVPSYNPEAPWTLASGVATNASIVCFVDRGSSTDCQGFDTSALAVGTHDYDAVLCTARGNRPFHVGRLTTYSQWSSIDSGLMTQISSSEWVQACESLSVGTSLLTRVAGNKERGCGYGGEAYTEVKCWDVSTTFTVLPTPSQASSYDTDDDGVTDDVDECLDTPTLLAVLVDENGCVQYIDDETGTASEYVPEEDNGFQWDTKAKLGAVLIGLGTILVFLF